MLNSERVSVRQLTSEDVDEIHRWFNDKDSETYFETPIENFPKWRVREIVKNSFGGIHQLFGITKNDTGEFIGLAGLHRISMKKGNAWTSMLIGKVNLRSEGFGSEAGQLILQYGFTVLNLRKIMSEFSRSNIASEMSLRKMGYALVDCDKDEDGLTKMVIARDRYLTLHKIV